MSNQFGPDPFGPLEPVWAPPAGRVIDVRVTRLYSDPLYGKPRGVEVDQGLAGAQFRAALFSDTGSPLVIDVGGYAAPPVVEARYREASGFDPYTTCAEAALSPDGRSVLVRLPDTVADQPGVYTTQFRVLDGGGAERVRNEFWVYVNRGLWTTTGDPGRDTGVPTTREVRTATRDHPGANRLLGNYDFDDAEVAMAVVFGVQRFAQAFPPIGRNFATTKWPVPWRRPLTDACLGFLFELAAAYNRRGELPYSAGGVKIDDLSKEQPYIKAAEQYLGRFDKWCQLTKSKISIAAGFGSTGSGYPGPSTYT